MLGFLTEPSTPRGEAQYVYLDDDVKAGARLPDGQLKRVSEAKSMTGEHKYGSQFTFTVRTLPILLCNNPPSLADLSYGMQRRLLVVPFDRTFMSREEDRVLFDRIWATELSGILNRFLAGLTRVIQRGWRLDTPPEVEAAKEEWLIEANPVPAFIQACCKLDPVAHCWMSELYRAYLNWATEAGITRPQQQSTFRRNLEFRGLHLVHGNRGDKVLGLKLR